MYKLRAGCNLTYPPVNRTKNMRFYVDSSTSSTGLCRLPSLRFFSPHNTNTSLAISRPLQGHFSRPRARKDRHIDASAKSALGIIENGLLLIENEKSISKFSQNTRHTTLLWPFLTHYYAISLIQRLSETTFIATEIRLYLESLKTGSWVSGTRKVNFHCLPPQKPVFSQCRPFRCRFSHLRDL